jgi:glycosyltransferase involved in cell wall biosynthesis
MTTPHNFSYSAILTCYNAQESIGKALEGIYAQTLPPSEIIVVDDCSTDESLRELERFNDNVIPLHILKNAANMGQSWSRNLAIQSSTSDYAVIFDDDDYSLPGRAEEHSRLFNLGSVMNFVSSNKYYENGHETQLLNQDLQLSGVTRREALLNVLVGKPIKGAELVAIPASTSAISVLEFLETGGYDVEFRRLEDAELFIRFANGVHSFAWSSLPLVNRFATFNGSKGGTIETSYELKILAKYRKEISEIEYSNAENLIELRHNYFGRNYLRLIFSLIINPGKIRILISKFSRAVKRVLHDISIRKTK